MKVISIIGLVITVIIIGITAAMYFNAATAPVTNIPEVKTPYGDIGGSGNPQNAIGAARSIVSMDKNRQNDMQNMLDKIDGKTPNP